MLMTPYLSARSAQEDSGAAEFVERGKRKKTEVGSVAEMRHFI